jgi:hypothetical protein
VSGLAQRADTFRALRAEVEASILPLATSVDGRRFSFQAGVNGLALTTIVAVLSAGSLLGVVGAILAVPFAAVIKIVLREARAPRRVRMAALRDPQQRPVSARRFVVLRHAHDHDRCHRRA